MAETLENVQIVDEITIVPTPDIWDVNNWKSQPTIKVAEETTSIVEEKETEEQQPIVEEIEHKIEEKPQEILAGVEQVKFANEESEKVFNLLKDGKIDDVYAILSEQKRLSTADKLPPADIIKLNLQYQNKDFTQQEINDLFDDTYMMPEKPVQDITEDDEDFKPKMDKYEAQVRRIESRIARDSKPATAELLKLSKEIVLPDIQRKEINVPTLTQEELEAQETLFLKSVDDATNALNGYKVTFKDEEVSIPVTYKLTKEEKAAIQPLIALSNSNGVEFLTKIGWLDEKGNINAQKLAEDLPLILNKEAIIQKMVNETGNKRHEASIKAIKNIDYTGGKQNNVDVGKTPEQVRQAFESAFFI